MPVASAIKTLIVDDQQTMRSLIRTSLHALGINQTREAPDGEEALRAMLSLPVNLVITDFNMPKLDGLQLLKAIRAFPATKKVPFFILTGRGDRELVQKAAGLGANNFLIKPLTAPVLLKTLETVLGKLQ